VTDITDHIADIRRRTAAALQTSGRSANGVTIDRITLVAVSKHQSAQTIESAWRAGLRHFGESYVQEAESKMPELTALPIEWHFIGRIQANKTRQIAALFSWVHTVDRARVARRLNDHRPHFAPPLNVFLQVNLTGQTGRAGVSGDQLPDLAREVSAMPRLKLCGLMTLPPAEADESTSADVFRRLRLLADSLQASGLKVPELSMGMSGDFETAIAEGATFIRIGSALFGPRDPYAAQTMADTST
jgi:PLP dependent protein